MVKVRRATAKDVKRIWEIRNHPKVRRASGNSSIIPFSAHQEWFEKNYVINNRNYCYVLIDKERTVGYCRLDWREDGYFEVSIAIDGNHQGKGFGNLLIKETLSLFCNYRIIAYVKSENSASLNLFIKNGFEISKKNTKPGYLILVRKKTADD